MEKRVEYVVGVDYGTDSCRSVIVDVRTGETVASAVSYYPRWRRGEFCDPAENRYRQHPDDYIESLEISLREALLLCSDRVRKSICGIAFDTTGSSPVLVDRNGNPLAWLPGLSENPDAMFILWKDHTAIREAEEINELAHRWKVDYTSLSGRNYSSEWFWAKALHVLRGDEEIRRHAYSIVEHCDWMAALLTGNCRPEKMKRGRCAAGHKAMWAEKWGGLPSAEFLNALDPLLTSLCCPLYTRTETCEKPAGRLTSEWAGRLKLKPGIPVSVGAIDAHAGAIGAGIREERIVRIMGTSTCDIIVASPEKLGNRCIEGICGQVDGSVLPGLIGLEAGQSAFGDIYAWFKELLSWPLKAILPEVRADEKDSEIAERLSARILPRLSEEAARIPAGRSSLIATDWLNGRRTPDLNPLLKGTLSGLTLASGAPLIFRALVEATAYGSKAIIDRFTENNIVIKEIVAIGGIAKKSPFVMQTLADVLEMPIKIAASDQTCALGAAMIAATTAGIYPTLEKAQQAMGQGFSEEYRPDPQTAAFYRNEYEKYRKIGVFFENLR